MKLLKERKEVWNRYGLALLAAYAFKKLEENLPNPMTEITKVSIGE